MTDEMDRYEGYDDFGQEAPPWGHLTEYEERMMRRHHLANPDDYPVSAPRGGRPHTIGPDYTGTPGFVAIVQGQVYLVAAILILQLFLITTGLFELLSGRTEILWWIAGGSLVAFLITLVITLWPRRRIVGGVRGLRG